MRGKELVERNRPIDLVSVKHKTFRRENEHAAGNGFPLLERFRHSIDSPANGPGLEKGCPLSPYGRLVRLQENGGTREWIDCSFAGDFRHHLIQFRFSAGNRSFAPDEDNNLPNDGDRHQDNDARYNEEKLLTEIVHGVFLQKTRE